VSKTAQMTRIVRPLRGGQITIPVAFRRVLGIDEDTMLRLTLKDGELRLKPIRVEDDDDADDVNEGSPWLRELYEYFAPVREEILARGISEEEVNADIDAAIEEVRAEERARQR
jgi:bifunctional DNA-binding transcriptional regulator/antitoxin component of YhaV-PrlF toxin-antitoxin module